MNLIDLYFLITVKLIDAVNVGLLQTCSRKYFGIFYYVTAFLVLFYRLQILFIINIEYNR